jgi:E3 ubiquitin-protein ligase UBR4
VGVRWHCDVCQDFDICDSCYQSGVELDVPPHTPDHELVRIEITMPLEAPAVPALAYPARAAPAAVAASKQPMEVSLAQ